MNACVEQAIEEIHNHFPGHPLVVEADEPGGAFVKVENLNLGSQYAPSSSWVGFHISFQYPHPDIYPHYVCAELRRTDGKPFQPPIHPNHQWALPSGSQTAVMVSRRSKPWNPATDSASLKLAKVLDWLRAQ